MSHNSHAQKLDQDVDSLSTPEFAALTISGEAVVGQNTTAFQAPVLSVQSGAPPVSPNTGDRYLLAEGGVLPIGPVTIVDPLSGAWAGQNNKITEWDGSQWVFYTPAEGWTVYVVPSHSWARYTSDVWRLIGYTFPEKVLGLQNTPPESPLAGDRYLAGTAPTGAWSSFANQIVEYSRGWFSYGSPQHGTVVMVASRGEGTPPDTAFSSPRIYVYDAGDTLLEPGRSAGWYLWLSQALDTGSSPRFAGLTISGSQSEWDDDVVKRQTLREYPWQELIISTLDTPPVSPNDWGRHIVGTSPTDDFAGHPHEVAVYQPAVGSVAAQWNFFVPEEGWQAYDVAAGLEKIYNGSAWVNKKDVAVTASDEAAKERTGFVNQTDSVLSKVDGTRTFTAAPESTSYDVFSVNKKITISSSQDVVWADEEGMHYFYIDAAGVLQTTTTFDASEFVTGDKCFVAALYWDQTNQECLLDAFLDERHGISMPGADHYYLHENEGTRISVGGALTDILADESGTLDTHAQFGVNSSVIWDEDIIKTPSAVASTVGLPVIYMEGAEQTWRNGTPTAGFSLLNDGTTGRLLYNNPDAGGAGIWGLTVVPNNDFMLMHIAVSTLYDGSKQYFAVAGQAFYANSSAARAGAATELSRLVTGDLPLAEFKFIATVIFKTADNISNAVQASIVSTDAGDDYIDWRGVAAAGSGSGSLSSNLAADLITDTANFDGNLSAADTTVQAALETLDDITTFQELHTVSAVEVTNGYFTLTNTPTEILGVRVEALNGVAQIHKQTVGIGATTPDFDVLNTNEVHINNNGAATGLSEDIVENDILLITYRGVQV